MDATARRFRAGVLSPSTDETDRIEGETPGVRSSSVGQAACTNAARARSQDTVRRVREEVGGSQPSSSLPQVLFGAD
jgi:hypothetical protein